MTAEESRQAFKQWIEGDAYAKDHRGQYAERNSNLTKWEHEINLHLAQTIYNPKGLGKLELLRHHQLCQYVEQEVGSNLWFTL